MKCPECGESNIITERRPNGNTKCLECDFEDLTSSWKMFNGEDTIAENFRPNHYKKGHDTFAWAENKFDLETNLAICQFNIHKYNDREKGQNVSDYEKIIVYAQRALDLIKEDKMEVTFDEK